MAEQLANDDIQPIPERHPSPGFITRLNRWAARPGGLLTLQLAGMAAAAALGFALAQRHAPVYADNRPVVQSPPQAAQWQRALDQQQQEIAELTRRNDALTKEAEEQELDLAIAGAEADALRQQNAQMKKAVTVFRESRRLVFPRAPMPLPIRVPKATVVAINQGAKEGVLPDGAGGFVVVRRPSPNVADALKNGLKKPAQIAALTSAELARGGRSTELQSPIGTVLRPGPVALRWSKVPGATSYTVSLTDEKGADVLGKEGEKVTAAESPFGMEWTPPKALGGGTYRWQVTANMPDGVGKTLTAAGKPAAFAVLDSKRVAELTAAEAQFAGNQLELGVRYARMGLLDDAEAALIPFVAAYPDSVQAKRLLEQVRGWRRFKLAGS